MGVLWFTVDFSIAAVVPQGAHKETVFIASVALDKLLHFAGFFWLASLALYVGPLILRDQRTLLFLVLLFGVAIELLQYWLPCRAFNPADIVANCLGVGFAIISSWIAKCVLHRRNKAAVASR